MDNQIFVKIEDYNEVLNVVKVVKEKISKAQETINTISELKAEEDKELEQWSNNLKSVTMKVDDIEKSITQTKQE